MSLDIALKNFVQQNCDSKTFDLSILYIELETLCEYCDFKGIQINQICNDFKNRQESDDWEFEKRIHETESAKLIKEYYSTTQIYLLELTLVECCWVYKALFRLIADFAKKKKICRAIDYGGGVGGLVIYLNRCGIYCDYADVPGTTWDYANYRFRKEDADILQLSQNELTKMSSNYDLITSLDCLEHLKPLPEYIRLFNSLLKTSGFLLSTSTFRGDGLHLSSNYKYDHIKTFNEMMESNGFDFNGQLINRWGRNFLIPSSILKLLKPRPVSGRKLIYTKRK